MWVLILVFANGLSLTVPLDTVMKPQECLTIGEAAMKEINAHVSDDDSVEEVVCERQA